MRDLYASSESLGCEAASAVQIFEEGKIKVELCNAMEVMNQNENMKN